MSNFFHNLVTRSRAPLDVVRPRVPSMFEPAASALPVFGAENLIEEREEPESPESPLAGRRPPGLDITLERTEIAQPRRISQPAAAAPEPRHFTPGAPPPVMVSAQPADTRAPFFSARQEPPASEQQHQPRLSAEADPLRVQAQDTVTREIREILHEREVRTEREYRTISARNVPSAVPSPVRDRLVQALVSPSPGIARSEPQRQAPPQPQAEPEPVIHVSIGRIEVRAVSETPRARSEKQAIPVMSLEEYLRGRDKGAAR